jgi:hypothetical protein
MRLSERVSHLFGQLVRQHNFKFKIPSKTRIQSFFTHIPTITQIPSNAQIPTKTHILPIT